MSMRDLVTTKLTKTLVTSVLNLLSSASSSLQASDMSDLVNAALENYQTLNFSMNNDLGLCVEHLTNACFYQHITDAVALEQQYAAMIQDDALVSDLMDKMAHGIAEHLSTPFYDVRSLLPKQAKTIAEKINNQIPTDLSTNSPPILRQFSWGQLASSTVRNTAVMYTKDRVACFKRDTPQSYDTDRILQYVVDTSVTPITTSSAIQPLLTATLTKALETQVTDVANRKLLEDRLNTAVGLVLRPQSHQRWLVSTQKALLGKEISSAVIDVTDMIDAIESLLGMVTTSMLCEVCDNINAASTTLLANIETIRGNILMIRAAMLYHKESALTDRLVLTENTVQSHVLQDFITTGGNESMIHDYLSYLKLNPNYEMAPNGVSAQTITTIHEKARAAVVAKAARLNDIKKTTYVKSLQDALIYTLDVHHAEQIKTGTLHPATTSSHIQQRTRALMALNKKPLEDIALEYLAAMRTDPVAQILYKNINTELHALIGREKEVTSKTVAQATCTGITIFLLDKLVEKFATPLAA